MTYLPGTYALVLQATQTCHLAVGRLGEMTVKPGFYIYIGSAFGPGGLQGRLAHHQRPPASPHWHIDFLRQAAQVIEVWAVEGPEKREHAWARLLAACPACAIHLMRFGASDCHCPAHLVFVSDRPAKKWFEDLLGEVVTRWTERRLDVAIQPEH